MITDTEDDTFEHVAYRNKVKGDYRQLEEWVYQTAKPVGKGRPIPQEDLELELGETEKEFPFVMELQVQSRITPSQQLMMVGDWIQ